ncbi:MAG: DUF6062 family protein [Clostridia bacterium]
MQYHLETIPVWEAMEQNGGCPLCALHHKCEAAEVERSLGGSVMEPDARIRVNEKGICAKHHNQLFLLQNRLGHALLVDSHSKELLQKLERIARLTPAAQQRRGLFAPKAYNADALIAQLHALTQTCVICEAVDEHMTRYIYTFLHLWKTDTAFRERWESSNGVCIPHSAALLQAAKEHLSAQKQQAFAASLLTLLQRTLTQDEHDLEWFTLKFDYRNHDKPWGNSKNALERTINHLRGQCVGEDKKEQGQAL